MPHSNTKNLRNKSATRYTKPPHDLGKQRKKRYLYENPASIRLRSFGAQKCIQPKRATAIVTRASSQLIGTVRIKAGRWTGSMTSGKYVGRYRMGLDFLRGIPMSFP